MKVETKLERIQMIDKLIDRKLEDVEKWKAKALSTTAPMGGERVQASGSQQKMADAVAEYLDIYAELEAEINALIDEKYKIIRLIERLDIKEYDVLYLHYVEGLEFGVIAAKYGKSYNWATEVKRKGIRHLQELIDEET